MSLTVLVQFHLQDTVFLVTEDLAVARLLFDPVTLDQLIASWLRT